MAEPKVKAAEAREISFPNPLKSGATFTIYSSLAHPPTPAGSVAAIGEGPHSEGYVAPGAGTTITFAPPDSTSAALPTVYVAICHLRHPPDMPGVGPDGTWNSGVVESCHDAFAAAAAHDDGGARVDAIIGPAGMTIDTCP